MNPMKEPQIEKVVVNIGVGESGEKLLKAEKVLQLLTKQKPIRTLSTTTNKELGIRKDMPIGCKVTLRKGGAEEFLKSAFWVKNNKISDYSFDHEGNFSFGIHDYTDFENMRYDPDIGIFGMDVCVSMCRKGKRVSTRTVKKSKIPKSHRLTPAETKKFISTKFGIEVVV
jgi:large subunit ribosomal protein L5